MFKFLASLFKDTEPDWLKYNHKYTDKCPKCGSDDIFTISLTGGWGSNRPTNYESCNKCGFKVDHTQEYEDRWRSKQ